MAAGNNQIRALLLLELDLETCLKRIVVHAWAKKKRKK